MELLQKEEQQWRLLKEICNNYRPQKAASESGVKEAVKWKWQKSIRKKN